MSEFRDEESTITFKTVGGVLLGMIFGFILLPLAWIRFLGYFRGFEWVVALISLGIFLFGYKLVKYTEGAPDLLGGIILAFGYTLLVFSVWYWAPIIALHIPIYKDFITIGLITGCIAVVIGIILMKKYTSEQKHLNDIGEILGLIYGGFMIYVWFTNIIIVPLLRSVGINIMAQIDPWNLLNYF